MVLRFVPYINILFAAPILLTILASIVFGIAIIGFKIFDYFEERNR